MKKYKYLLFFIPIIALIGCEDPYKDSPYQIYDVNPVSTYLSEEEGFSEWVTVLKYSDMYNALNQADIDFTAFVPSNSAVEAFYEKMGVDSIQQLGKNYARSMVLYHTVLDTISRETFINLEYTTNLSGDRLTIQIDPLTAGKALLDGNARVVEMAIHVSNGLIYVLDDVMKPLVETVYDRVAENSSYSIMKQALDATGWSATLKTLADTVIIDGASQISQKLYTFLAVSNETFAKDGINSYENLKVKLNAGNDVTNSENELNKYVAYHIIESSYKLENFQTFSGSDTSSLWDTQAKDQVLMITLDTLSNEKYFINLQGTKATFIENKSDVLAKNGYLHEISSYLPVWVPQQTTVVWDLTDYADVRNIVGKEIYQPTAPVASETKVSLFEAGSYTSAVSASGVAGQTYSYLTYVTCKTNLKSALHYDRLVLNLGYMGSVSMKTPTLVRGKYKVTLKFIYLSDHAFMKSMTDGNGGLMKISFDNENVRNVSPYTTVPSTLAGVYEATLYDEIEFGTTSNHVFKTIVMDPSASTNSKFSIQLDCITFTPITE